MENRDTPKSHSRGSSVLCGSGRQELQAGRSDRRYEIFCRESTKYHFVIDKDGRTRFLCLLGTESNHKHHNARAQSRTENNNGVSGAAEGT